MQKPIRILFLAAEAAPFVKIGGLGDVAGSLPPALKELDPNIDIRLAIPFHGAIQRQAYDLHSEAVFNVPTTSGQVRAEALSMYLDSLPVYLIGGPPIARDAPVYSGDNLADGYKFTYFSLAALELARLLDWTPDVIHANDWHTAPAVYALDRVSDTDEFYRNATTLLGLHNLPYLGDGAGPALGEFGLPPATGSNLPWWAQHMPLPLGLLSADHIVAVSPNYAQEILTPEFGTGLDGFLRMRRQSISGILNGIDMQQWDPAEDTHLPENFDLNDTGGRLTNKNALQREFHLPAKGEVPLVSMVSRMDYQKGVDLLPEAFRMVRDLDWQVIILGTGHPDLETAVYQIESEFPDRVRVAIRFDSALSRRIFGGADLTLIPSRYEPCGLTQMIAMRYGCIPVARATGGLVDTIRDLVVGDQGNGFLFQEASSASLAGALRRAILAYRNGEAWLLLQNNAMSGDFSWQSSAQQYLSLYNTMTRPINDTINLERRPLE